MKWADGKVKALGVWFCTDQNEGMKRNYEDKVQKVEGILNNWQNKRLTLPGKITIMKTLVASQRILFNAKVLNRYTRAKYLEAV